MAAKAKLAPQPAPPILSVTGALTEEERIHRIEVIAKRIDGYVRFMCQITSHTGLSAEVKEKAVIEFYEQMILVDSRLARIHDQLRLE